MVEVELFKQIYQRLSSGHVIAPRGLKVKEVENFHFTLPPRVRFVNFKARRLNLNYIKHELKWYFRGDKYDLSILNQAELWKGLVTSYNTINSNYGQYIFRTNQFTRVISELVSDRDSRRASLVILSQDHLLSNDVDLPCTYSMNFRIRNNKLNCSVHMRSQDAIYGLGNDLPFFSIIQEMVWAKLLNAYPTLKLGDYHHCVDSMHVYEKHWLMLDQILLEDNFKSIACPQISGPEEVDFLLGLEFNNIPIGYQFTAWLHE